MKNERLMQLMRGVPSVLVLGLLAGVFVWGHRTGWRAPDFGSLRASAQAGVAADDWCEEHNVPESRCVECHPEVLAVAGERDWCAEHGVPESSCTVCHPEMAIRTIAASGVPEYRLASAGTHEGKGDDCCPVPVKVKPAPVVKADDCCPVTGAQGSAGGPTREHQLETGATSTNHRRDAGATHATHAHRLETGATQAGAAHGVASKGGAACQTHVMRVQFASGETLQKAGVQTRVVTTRPMVEELRVNAEIKYDQTRVAQVSARASGAAWRVEVNVGDSVEAGQVLALVDAAEVGRAKAEFLQARTGLQSRTRVLERVQRLVTHDVSSQSRLDEAQADHDEARIRLFNARQALVNLGIEPPDDAEGEIAESAIRHLGIPESLRASIDTRTANLLPVVAPIAGRIITQNLVAGEAVEPGKAVFVIADTRRMWLIADVPQARASEVRIGQRVVFVPETPAAGSLVATGRAAESGNVASADVAATISWISTEVDDRTRTLRVRAEVENAEGALLANTFGRAQIQLRTSGEAVAVPSEAVQWEGCCTVAFVQAAEDTFVTRKVRAGATQDGWTEVLVGLLPGETVATAGSHVLKSKLLSAKLGATCGGDH